jgi:hypothetical protein
MNKQGQGSTVGIGVVSVLWSQVSLPVLVVITELLSAFSRRTKIQASHAPGKTLDMTVTQDE